MPSRLSRTRYEDYRGKLKQRRKSHEPAAGDSHIPGPMHGSGETRKRKPRSRSFTKLLAQFWGLLAGYRKMLVFVLLALGVSTVLGLAPLYGTKIVFDSVLREHPLPARLPAWVHLP